MNADLALARKLLDIEMETKGLRRFVRTPEGARKYRKPIGSLIEAGDRNPVERARKRRDEQAPDRAVLSGNDGASNNENVPYQVYRADKELKKVDLKSGEFTRALLENQETNPITTVGDPDGPLGATRIARSMSIGYENIVGGFWGPYGSTSIDVNPDYSRGLGANERDSKPDQEIRIRDIEWDDPRDEVGSFGFPTTIRVRPAKKTADRAGKLKYVATVEYGFRRGGAFKQFLAETPEEAFEAAARAIVLRDRRMTQKSDEYDAEGMWPLNRRERDYDGVLESWPGIRGYDFLVDDSDTEVDWTDREARADLAQRDAMEMGYALLDNSPSRALWGRNDASTQKMSVRVMETVNALMRSHEERFPGFTNLFGAIALVGDEDWATAYNGFGSIKTPVGAFVKTQVMGMSDKFFADNSDARSEATRLINGEKSNRDGNRWTFSLPRERYQMIDATMTDQQMVALSVMTHEIGHTIGYILQGRLVGDALDGDENTSKNYDLRVAGTPNQDSLAVQHRARMLEILKEYGIFDPKKAKKQQDAMLKKEIESRQDYLRVIDMNIATYERELRDPRGNHQWAEEGLARYREEREKLLERVERAKAALPAIQEQEWMNIDANGFGKDDPFNRQAISEHLSTYGATNVSEIFAETWATYQLDPNPGDYVREMGELMETALLDYLAKTNQEAIYKPKVIRDSRANEGLTTFDPKYYVNLVMTEAERTPGHPKFDPTGKGDNFMGQKEWREQGVVRGYQALNPGEPVGRAVIDTLSEDPPVLRLRSVEFASDDDADKEDTIRMYKATDKLWEFNFQTERWEAVE